MDPFEKWMNQGRTVVEISDVASYVSGVRDVLMKSGQPWGNGDVRRAIEKKYGAEKFALSGMALIVKGETQVVAMTSKQIYVLEGLYDISTISHIIQGRTYVVAENSKGESETAQLKWISSKVPEGRIVVSRGLADKLKLESDDNIKINFEGQDISDLDLDKY